MSNPIYRLYIAEYERCMTWMNGGTSAFLKYVKPYDMYIVYITGRSKLPPDYYMAALKKLGDQCQICDATQMPDDDLHEHMLTQIEKYASDDTYVYFMCSEADYVSLKGRTSNWKAFAQTDTYRTGQIHIPMKKENPEEKKEKPAKEKECITNESAGTDTGQDLKNTPENKSTPANREKVVPAHKKPSHKKKNRKDNRAQEQKEERQPLQPVHNSTGKNEQQKPKKIERQGENTFKSDLVGIFLHEMGSVNVGKQNTDKKDLKEDKLPKDKAEMPSEKVIEDQPEVEKRSPSLKPKKEGTDNKMEPRKKPWKQRISKDPKSSEENTQTDSSIQDLEKAIFGAKQSFTEIKKTYTELDDSKAKTVSLLADRLIDNINLLVKGINEYQLSYEDYMELIATLVKSENIDDFQEGWATVHPGCNLSLNETVYRSILKEAQYYAKTCDVLYGEDIW